MTASRPQVQASILRLMLKNTEEATPGPWKVGKGDDDNLRVYDARGTVICQFHNGSEAEYQEYNAHRNAEANARLIAAAPPLLALAEAVAGLASVEDTDERAMLAERYAADAIQLVRDLHGEGQG